MSWAAILKEESYIEESAEKINKMAKLIERTANLAGDVYELAEKNEDTTMTNMIYEVSQLIDDVIVSMLEMINRLNTRQEEQ